MRRADPCAIPATSAVLISGQPPDAPQQTQILAIDVLHRKMRCLVEFADIVNAADVRMRDLSRNSDLIVKTWSEN